MNEKISATRSRTIMAQMALPDQANPAGNVHGGELSSDRVFCYGCAGQRRKDR